MTTQKNKRYTRFYLTMLILSTISASFGIANLLTIPSLFSALEESRFYAAFSFILVAVWVASVVALILLWRKKELGIQLQLSCYAVSVIATLGLAVSAGPIIETVGRDVQQELARQQTESISASALQAIVESTYYMSLGFSIMISLVFASLWLKAWRQQQATDLAQSNKNTPA